MAGAVHGAIQGWRNAGPVPIEMTALQRRYSESWALYTGELFEQMTRFDPYRNDPAIYDNIKLLWKHAEAVVDFYAGVIYQGALSTDGTPLPNGAVNAIPIHVQVSDETRAQYLRAAFAELCSAWNWQQQMSLRPMYASSLGDCLTELVDDLGRGFIYPQTVWPGYVTDVELDYVDNVRAYTVEYHVTETRPGGVADTYLYRKDVDGEAFRYYRDDKPHDYGDGAVVPNPYGFVPAVWDRHRIGAPGHVRGRSAIAGTRQAVLQLNSIFAHAFDFQRKAFFAPIMVAGKPPGKASNAAHDVTSAPDAFDIVGVPADASLLQAQFDIGKTREMLQDLRDGILDENPEARFYQQMREMQMVTAPGAERLMGDVKNRVDLARAGYDSQTVKLFQMAISMAGLRAAGEWKRDRNGRARRLSRRQMVFTRFDLESYGRGEMDFVIQSRPIVYPTEQERLEVIAMKESLQTNWGREQAGMDKTEREAIEQERQQARAAMLGAFDRGAFAGDYTEGE